MFQSRPAQLAWRGGTAKRIRCRNPVSAGRATRARSGHAEPCPHVRSGTGILTERDRGGKVVPRGGGGRRPRGAVLSWAVIRARRRGTPATGRGRPVVQQGRGTRGGGG